MKRTVWPLLFALLFFTLPAQAANGDVIGSIYSTDILAYVNGRPIRSYNIGGKTVILVEDLSDKENDRYNYGFDWWYDDTTRTLTVNSDGDSGYGEMEIQRGTPGEILGDVYETDIKVLFNTKEVPGYNVGGKTAVCIEDLGAADESSPNYAYDYSAYLCRFTWDERNRTVSLSTYQQADYYSFSAYPDHKLRFFLKDDQLSFSFDQMNDYRCSLSVDFSDEFLNHPFQIRPMYLDGDVVGNFYLGVNGKLFAQLNDQLMYEKTKDAAVILSYEEAQQYVADHFEILDTREDENATIYLAKQGDTRYLLYALKEGGLVVDSTYGPVYTTVELRETVSSDPAQSGLFYVYYYPLAGPPGSGTFGVEYMCSTGGYNFYRTYDCYMGGLLSDYTSTCTSIGQADLVIDGQHLSVAAIEAYAYRNQLLVDVDEICTLLGIDYHFRNGDFVFDTSQSVPHEISISFDSAAYQDPSPKPIHEMATNQVVLNGQESVFSYLGGGTLLTNGQTYEAEVFPYLYDQQAFVPFYFFEKLYQS